MFGCDEKSGKGPCVSQGGEDAGPTWALPVPAPRRVGQPVSLQGPSRLGSFWAPDFVPVAGLFDPELARPGVGIFT